MPLAWGKPIIRPQPLAATDFIVLNTSYLRSLFICISLSLAAPAIADNSKQQLNQVQSRIGELRQDLAQDQQQQNKLQTGLKSLEQQIGQLQRKLRTLSTQAKQYRQQHSKLDQQDQELQNQLKQLKQQLAQHLRASYSAGQQQALKLLLNQDNPAQVGRTLTYHRYLTEAQLNTVAATEDTLAELQQNAAAISDNQQRLQTTLNETAQQQQKLQQEQNKRKQLLAQLNRDIKDKNQALNKLMADEKRLLQLVEELKRRPQNYIPDGLSLSKLKGKLKWPTKGKILNRFGSSRLQGQRKWQGVFIAAALGNDVTAIAPGQIVFAEWIRGYGLMLIIDHGNDYMSVYAHNESLYKEAGDKVAAGEVIASVGNSGGQHRDGLYFEMRHKSSPIDPAQWCR